MIERILAIAGLSTLMAGAVFAGYQYKEVHLPEFKTLQATVAYQECIQRCQETCRANAIPLDKCVCSHCNVYKAH